jgi:tetratricopeptide (TPR) repeat protein
MPLEQLAAAHVELARLTGAWSHYAAAESLLERAFIVAPAGSGPFLSRARLYFTLHLLDRVEPDLVAVERQIVLDHPARAAVAGLRADVAFQRGRFAEARAAAESALALSPGMGAISRLAQIEWKTGDPVQAESDYLRAMDDYHGDALLPVAWTHLQLGLIDLDARRLPEALAHYQAGAAALPGWWLIEEHIAEVHALEGRLARAETLYRDLIERTGDPEFMDALAAICAATGREAESRTLIARAERIHMDRLAQFPEAAYGHALGHCLDHGRDPAFTLDLARRNFALRPNPEARALLDRAVRNAGALDATHAGPGLRASL